MAATRITFRWILLLTVCAAAPAAAATRAVPADYPTIAAGLGAADAGDVVLVAPGTYLEHDLILASGVVLRGASGNPADVVIDGQRLGRCLYGTGLDAATRIEAVTLFNGLPAYGSTPDNSWGGGLYVDLGALTVQNCVFLQNEAAMGGGAFIHGEGAPTFVDCEFVENQASETAGLVLYGTCDPQVRDCSFRGAYRTLVGGGLTWYGAGTAVIERCVVEDNEVWETGGGVEVFGTSAVAVLRECLIRGNTATYSGAGLYLGQGTSVQLEDCTITENSAGDSAAGVWVGSGAVLEAVQATILGNTAPKFPDGTVVETGAVTLVCCEADPAAWRTDGEFVLDNDGCTVTVEPMTWDRVKSLYR